MKECLKEVTDIVYRGKKEALKVIYVDSCLKEKLMKSQPKMQKN